MIEGGTDIRRTPTDLNRPSFFQGQRKRSNLIKDLAMSEQDGEEKKEGGGMGLGLTSVASITDSLITGDNNQNAGNSSVKDSGAIQLPMNPKDTANSVRKSSNSFSISPMSSHQLFI